MIRALFLCYSVFILPNCRGGIQPERLNAEGGALAQPPEYRHPHEKRLEDAKAAVKASDFRVFQTHNGG